MRYALMDKDTGNLTKADREMIVTATVGGIVPNDEFYLIGRLPRERK